jgi:hypothetical protein
MAVRQSLPQNNLQAGACKDLEEKAKALSEREFKGDTAP